MKPKKIYLVYAVLAFTVILLVINGVLDSCIKKGEKAQTAAEIKIKQEAASQENPGRDLSYLLPIASDGTPAITIIKKIPRPKSPEVVAAEQAKTEEVKNIPILHPEAAPEEGSGGKTTSRYLTPEQKKYMADNHIVLF